jgi:hypothetical protein
LHGRNKAVSDEDSQDSYPTSYKGLLLNFLLLANRKGLLSERITLLEKRTTLLAKRTT